MNAMAPQDPVRPLRATDSGGADPAARSIDDASGAVAERLRFALEELGRLGVDLVDGDAATALARDIARLVEERAEELDGTKRELWAAVAHARAALRARRERGTPITIAPRTLDRLVALHDEVVAAEAKAQRKLAAPSAYRKLIDAKRALAAALDEHGYASYDDLATAAAQTHDDETTEEMTARIAQDLATAEAAWAAFEASDPAALPAGPEADVLRVRAYQLLGRVVADGDLRQQLDDLAARGQRQADARRVLEQALRDAGLDPGTDAVAQGEQYLRMS